MLFRYVASDGPSPSSLWFASGDGLEFVADNEPALCPGPEAFDINGCEDPTVAPVDDGCMIYYTGVEASGTAQLLWASGPGPRRLTKRGVAHASTITDRNTKEAAIERLGERWLLLFEYSRGGKSRIGRSESDGPSGPWGKEQDPFIARPGRWDNWHLSTGPLLVDEPGGPVMFYNGASQDAVWAIGWVRFDAGCASVIERCEQPLIAAPDHSGPAGRQISFCASAVRAGETLWLYYTHDDRSLMRATVVRS